MDRRQFLKTSLHVGAGLILVRYIDFAQASSNVDGVKTGFAFASHDDNGRIASQRYEGPIKVTGGKIYGIDFRARDMVGWPAIERRSVILRTPVVGKIFSGNKKKKIIREFGVLHIFTGDDVAAWGCKGGAPFLMPEFYIPSNTAPFYLGQPLALLTFKSTEDFLLVKDKISTLPSYCRFGKEVAAKRRPSYGTSKFVRYLNDAGVEEYSFISPDGVSANKQDGAPYIKKIQQDLKESQWHVARGSYSTQCVDPMFMEPECGLSWYEASSKTLHLTLGTQSPYDDGIAIHDFFRDSKAPKIEKIIINCCFPGGGFGGRDSSDFPLHLALAALAEPNVSHRIVHTRPDQFQAGIKRHPAKMDMTLAADSSGKFQMIQSDIQFDGGGQNNYSFVVQSVGARNAGGVYQFQRSLVEAEAIATPAIPSGSMRGYGTLQAAFGLECLIDELATAIHIDPIELRKKNIIPGFSQLQTGVRLVDETHAIEILDAAKSCSLWSERKANKARRSNEKTLYGTGFAFGAKTFGKGDDACLAGLLLDQQGQLSLITNGVDMGNGSATTLPLSLKTILGRAADSVQIGATTQFDALQIYDKMAQNEAEQLSMSKDPRWVPLVSMSTAASTSAYQLRHSVLEAAKVLLEYGLWPAAVSILKLKSSEAKFDPNKITLNDVGLKYLDGREVAFKNLAIRAYELNLVTGVMVHAFYRTRWATASFKIDNSTYTSQIDAMAIRKGSGQLNPFLRNSVDFPSWELIALNANRMTCYAAIIAVEVAKETGEVKVVDAQTFLECGPPIERQIVEGQMEGAFAMGIGQTLKEGFPAAISEGPGAGGWNLHLYHLPLARDCAIGRAQFNIMPAHDKEDPKGMSEVVLNPVLAAITNAVADATGKRFRDLPLKSELIKASIS